MELSHARAIITGGASGLGAATARHFRDCRAQVMVLDLDGKGAETAADIGAGFAQPMSLMKTAWLRQSRKRLKPWVESTSA